MTLLSICIPTFNRKEALLDNLNCLVLQASEQTEIVISDNNSSDGTEEAVQKFIDAHPAVNITYSKNSSNIGPDKNFVKVLKLGKGKYRQLLGDDDMLKDNYLSEILPILEGQELSFLSLSNKSIQKRCGESESFKKNVKIYDKSQIANYLNDMSIFITFMSFMIFNGAVFESLKETQQFENTQLIQSFLAIDAIKSSSLPFGIFLTTVIKKCKTNETVNYNLYYVFGPMFFSFLLFSFDGDSKKARKSFKKGAINFIGSAQIVLKSNGYKKKIDGSFKLLGSFFKSWLLIFPVYILPNFAVKLMRKVYSLIKKVVKKG
jgi:glycosyltransferase involved in cell wall biosynthesis